MDLKPSQAEAVETAGPSSAHGPVGRARSHYSGEVHNAGQLGFGFRLGPVVATDISKRTGGLGAQALNVMGLGE